MAERITLQCNNCGKQFDRSYGIGLNGQGTLYCNRCGKALAIDFSGGWAPLPDCECGGTFDADALGRCPHCGDARHLSILKNPQR